MTSFKPHSGQDRLRHRCLCVGRAAGTCLARGHLRFVLFGQKLAGDFALTGTRMGGDDRNWILIKLADGYADSDRDPTATTTALS